MNPVLHPLLRIRKHLNYSLPRVGSLGFKTAFSFLPQNIRAELLPDLLVDFDFNDETMRTTFWQGSRFEYPTPQVLASWGASCDRFFDIGANYGFFSFWMISECKHILVNSFEPNPTTFQRLSSTKQLNSLDRLSMWPLGLSDETGKIPMSIGDKDSGHSTFGAHPDLQQKSTTDIAVQKFDDWLEDNRIEIPKKPQWIAKIDVEGYEKRVLDGMARSLSKKAFYGIAIELNEFTLEFCGSSIDEIRSTLASFDYEEVSPQSIIRNSGNLPSGNSFFKPRSI